MAKRVKLRFKKGKPLIKPANRGKFHEETGTPAGQKIPLKKIEQKLHSSDPEVRKEANFAKVARTWRKK